MTPKSGVVTGQQVGVLEEQRPDWARALGKHKRATGSGHLEGWPGMGTASGPTQPEPSKNYLA